MLMCEVGVVGHEDVLLVQAWIRDLLRVGCLLPPIKVAPVTTSDKSRLRLSRLLTFNLISHKKLPDDKQSRVATVLLVARYTVGVAPS